MSCDAGHDWSETGVRRPHVEGAMFKYGTHPVVYAKCSRCGWVGFRRPPSRVVYTWEQKSKHHIG
jgi:hypothetical protein